MHRCRWNAFNVAIAKAISEPFHESTAIVPQRKSSAEKLECFMRCYQWHPPKQNHKRSLTEIASMLGAIFDQQAKSRCVVQSMSLTFSSDEFGPLPVLVGRDPGY